MIGVFLKEICQKGAIFGNIISGYPGAMCPARWNRCVVVTEAGSYLRLIDFFITQLKAQGPSRTCNESKEEEEEEARWPPDRRMVEGCFSER